MQPTNPSNFNNTYSPQKLPNFASDRPQHSPFAPPKAATQDNASQIQYDLPTASADIIQYMKRRPFTQYLGGIQFTYSLLQKKQGTFLLTNERFLMLKGHEYIAYARVFPQDKELPFKTYQQVIAPKAIFSFNQIVKVESTNNEKLVIHFQKDKKKTSWQFACPNPSCALQWRRKIQDALHLHRGISDKSEHPLAISIFDKQGYKFISQLATNVINANMSPEVNSPIKRPEQGNSPNKNKPISVQFNGPNMNKVQDFIVDHKNSFGDKEPFLGKSMSKITTDEKEDFKFQLTKIKRDWIEQLLGGEQQGELIIDFRNYVQKIASVIIGELYLPEDQKIFPTYQQNNEYASYFLDDVYIEIYFLSKEKIDRKHPRYEIAQLQFRNMDYLLRTTQNEGILKVPFIVLFEYKGFLGMAKSKVSDNFTYKNKQCLSQFNLKHFEEVSRISGETLKNESTCRILSYERKTSMSQTQLNNRIYFVDVLTQLLPLQKGDYTKIPSKQLRPELIQDDQFDGTVFRDRIRPVRPQKITQLIDHKENELLKILQNQEQHFTNSRELSDLLHYSGLNIRRLGSVFQKSRIFWLKKILQAELIARSLKVYFKYDIQSCIRVQTERMVTRQRQQEIQHRRVINFLNILFGVSESTIDLWRRVNTYCKDHFGVYAFQNNYTDIHIPFFLQAIQHHLRIVLTDNVHQRVFFKTNNSLLIQDFIEFQFQSSYYNLDFTSTIEQIEECLEEKSPESFDNLSKILIKETSTNVPYFQFLRKHPIHDKICQYLLDFTSPEQSKDLYNRMEVNSRPSRFLYESKLAEIKWYLKQNKVDQIQNPLNFIYGHGQKWLGPIHPLFAQVNRILASYFSQHPQLASRSMKYAIDSLQMHKKIYGNDYPIMWIDYLYVGKANYAVKNIDQAINNLNKAKQLAKNQQLRQFENYSELNLLLARIYFGQRQFKQAYKVVNQLYNLIKKEKDQQSLSYVLEAVALIRQLYEVNRQYEPFFQFLQKDFCNNLNSFNLNPNLSSAAVRLLTVPILRHTILRRSKQKSALMSLVEQLSKVAVSAKANVLTYIGNRLKGGIFPLNFIKQLKEADSILQEIKTKKLVESWSVFYPTAQQPVIDSMGSLGRGEQFIINITALYNLFGKSMLDEIHLMDK